MDNEEAKFILQSFRPDGADASDPAFAEALAVAAADRDVGEWLARERAADAAFAAALGAVQIPEDLRESILAMLADERPEEFSEMDAAFVGALAGVAPPEGLRDQILTAMNAGAGRLAPVGAAPRRVGMWLRTAAVAAAVVLGAWVAIQMTGGSGGPSQVAGVLTPASLERLAIENLNNHVFKLDHQDGDAGELLTWLEGRDLPVPRNLPAGLESVRGIGCKILKLNETEATLVCFLLESGQVVHMVTLDRLDVVGNLPKLSAAKGNCHGCKRSGWSSVIWSDEGQTYVLLGKMKPTELAAVF